MLNLLPVARYFLWSGLLLLTFPNLRGTGQAPRAWAAEYEEFFDQQLFHERVKGLNQVKIGDSLKEVLRTLGPPQVREPGPGGTRVCIYRVRCYAGLEPGSRWARQLSLIYEMRLTFDREDRLQAIQTEP